MVRQSLVWMFSGATTRHNGITMRASLPLVGAMLIGLLSTAARADVILYEPFDYANGSTLSGQSGGTGFEPGAAWLDRFGADSGSSGTISAGGLSYSDGVNQLETSGGHYDHLKFSGGINRKIDVDSLAISNPSLIFEDTTNFTPGNHIGKDGSSLWVSFLYQGNLAAGETGFGGLSFSDGEADDDGTLRVDGAAGTPGKEEGYSLPPDPTLDPSHGDFGKNRMLRGFDFRGDFGGEKNGVPAGTDTRAFSLSGHRGPKNWVPSDQGHPVADSALDPVFVLLKIDFKGDPSNPNTNTLTHFDTGETIVEPNEYYTTWPKADDDPSQVDEISMWLNPSLSTEPAAGTEALKIVYESEDSEFVFVPRADDPNPLDAFKTHFFADRFDFKIDSINMNAKADGTLYDEIRLGTTFGDVTPTVGGPNVDIDGDGDVDGADFLAIQRTNPPLIPAWEAAYGGAPLAGVVGVPEPTTLALVFLGCLGLAAKSR